MRPSKGQKSEEERPSTRATVSRFRITIVKSFVLSHLERRLVTDLDVHEYCNTTSNEEYVENQIPGCQHMYVIFGVCSS